MNTFLCARVGSQPSRSEPEPSPPQRRAAEKTTRKKKGIKQGGLCARQVPPWVVSPKRPNPALRAYLACPTVWYRRSVPNRGTTKIHPAPGGWVGAVFLGSPPTLNTLLVPPGVCGSWPLLTVWDPRFSWAHRQPSTHIWSLLECAAPGRSSQYGTRAFPGLTANPQPPSICLNTSRK